jgi:hypothetical protein
VIETVDGTADTDNPGSTSVRPAILVWVVLMVVTALSWWLGAGHGASSIATVAVLSVAFTKVGLIGEHFMELRHALPLMRALFGLWCGVMFIVLAGIYLLG